jgi:hypothetical protein
MKHYLFIVAGMLLLTSAANAQNFSLRKYQHVKAFYQSISESALKLGLEYNVPPAAIMAIAGLESGYGDGYVSRITGNILSLGARKGEPELPPLYLPTHEPSNTVLVAKSKIESTPTNELVWKKRPPSLKKDYRPENIAGTDKQLGFLSSNRLERIKARKKNINDFVSSWISYKSKTPVFLDARTWLDAEVKKNTKKSLLSCDLGKQFIARIGGKPRSFNHRPSWVKKAGIIFDRAGLCSLASAMSKGAPFEKAWAQKD